MAQTEINYVMDDGDMASVSGSATNLRYSDEAPTLVECQRQGENLVYDFPEGKVVSRIRYIREIHYISDKGIRIELLAAPQYQ